MASTSAPLALDSVEHGQATGLRRGEDSIDALAYIDNITPEEQRSAEALIKEEIKAMGKRPADYLKELPKIHQVKFEGHPVLQTEYERVRQGLPLADIDKSRFKCLPPTNRKNDVFAWQSSLANAQSQLEHQYNRLLNLELLLVHGPKSWQAYIRSLEVALERLKAEASTAKQQVTELNQRRKLKHQKTGEELAALEGAWLSLVQKNLEIASACDVLEQELAAVDAS